MGSTPLYDALSADYDRFVDWPERRAHDLPFVVGEIGPAPRRILDVACGTGGHAIALAQRGYGVVGADISTGMIARARENAAREAVTVRFVEAGFGELATRVGGGFDGLICLGNSLPHVPDAAALREALADFAQVVRPGGVCIIQQRNFDLVACERQRFMPLQAHREGDREWLFLRFYDFEGDRIRFNMVVLRREGTVWTYDVQASELWPIFHRPLLDLLEEVGFGPVQVYGGLGRTPFHVETSGSLVISAGRRGPG